MSIEVSNVAVDPERLSATFAEVPSNWSVLDDVKADMKDRDFSDHDIRFCLSISKKFLVPVTQLLHNNDEFNAYLWLVCAIGEEIEIPMLQQLNSWALMVESGVWQLMTMRTPDFRHPLSSSNSSPPGFGFIPWEQTLKMNIREFFAHAFGGSKTTTRVNEVATIQQEFIDVLESLACDKLHLLTIVT